MTTHQTGPVQWSRQTPPDNPDDRAVVDFPAVGRRLLRLLALAAAVVVGGSVLLAVVPAWQWSWRSVGEIAGWTVVATLVIEISITASTAVVGLLRAGERGDRLAGSDVSLLPPQLRRRR